MAQPVTGGDAFPPRSHSPCSPLSHQSLRTWHCGVCFFHQPPPRTEVPRDRACGLPHHCLPAPTSAWHTADVPTVPLWHEPVGETFKHLSSGVLVTKSRVTFPYRKLNVTEPGSLPSCTFQSMALSLLNGLSSFLPQILPFRASGAGHCLSLTALLEVISGRGRPLPLRLNELPNV